MTRRCSIARSVATKSPPRSRCRPASSLRPRTLLCASSLLQHTQQADAAPPHQPAPAQARTSPRPSSPNFRRDLIALISRTARRPARIMLGFHHVVRPSTCPEPHERRRPGPPTAPPTSRLVALLDPTRRGLSSSHFAGHLPALRSDRPAHRREHHLARRQQHRHCTSEPLPPPPPPPFALPPLAHPTDVPLACRRPSRSA